MKKILILLLCSLNAHAQVQLAASYFKEAEAAAKHQKLWKLPVYGPMLFVDQATRLTYANQPDSSGVLRPEGGIYSGYLPKEIMVANTAIRWGGRTWSVMLWPLPADQNERVGLLLHESFHRIQEQLGFPGNSPTADHLGQMEGRIYFILELNALKAALQKPKDQRRTDLANALAFRQKRKQLFPATFLNERILEMNEGLAEYTGAILGRKDLRQHLYSQIDTATQRKSLIRSCAYLTGPVYGMLLDEKAPGWTKDLRSTDGLPELIGRYYQINPAETPNEANYNGSAIRTAEQEKEKLRLQILAAYTEVFTKKPVLTIDLIKMNVVFNPNTLFDLGDLGTLYPTGEVKDVWGHLKVAKNGMLLKNWRTVTVPGDDKGWTLELAPGWEKVQVAEGRYTLQKKP